MMQVLWAVVIVLSYQFLPFQTVDASTKHSSLVQTRARVGSPLMLPKLLTLFPPPIGSSNPPLQAHAASSNSAPLGLRPSPTFDYSDGPNGPSHWGELNPEWTLCKTGNQQSPMTILPTLMVTNPNLGDLRCSYTSEPIDVTIANDGHDFKVIVPSNSGVLRIYNVTHRPVSFHFHHPSEHRIMNYSFPLELHLVHKSEIQRIAVVAWLFVSGDTNTFLAQFVDKLPTHKNPYKRLKIQPIILPKIEPNHGRYRGSLTTPPCSETVICTVMLWNFPSVSDYQLKLIKAAMSTRNARPGFPSWGRKFHIIHALNWSFVNQAFKDI